MKIGKSILANRGVKAFTLVELLAVVALMLLVLKLTLPSLRGLMGNKPHLIARGQLISDLNQARTLALRNGSPVYVVFMPSYASFDVSPSLRDITDTMQDAKNETSPQLRARLQAMIPQMQQSRAQQIALTREYLGDDTLAIHFYGRKLPRPKRFNRGNELMGMQLNAYALYAEFLPGDQPSQPSRRWLTNWKRLPEGFYFGPQFIQAMHDTAEMSGAKRLDFSRLKNGHDDGSDPANGIPARRMRLPYIMYNSRGELSARGNPGEIRVGTFQLALTEGGVFQPEKAAKFITDQAGQKFEFYGHNIVAADAPEVPEEFQKHTWLQINGLTGRADVLETAPDKKSFYFIRFLKMEKDPALIAARVNEFIAERNMGGKIMRHAWTGTGAQVWGYEENGMRFYKPGGVPPVAVSNLPRSMLMALILKLKRFDPKLELNYQKQDG